MSISKLFTLVAVLSLSFGSLQSVYADASKIGVWKPGESSPTKRTEVAAAAIDGKIYVVGGISKPSLSNALDYAISRAVEVYNPVSNTWSTTTPLPEGRHHAGIAVLNGNLFVIGGFAQSLLSV